MSDSPAELKLWLPGVEALRGIAALVVVVHHCWSLSTMPRFPGYWMVEGFGLYGVTLFFVLSGYLLSAYFWQPRSDRPLWVYASRRLFRILPALYVNIGLLFLFFAQHEVLFRRDSVRQVIANLTLTQYLFPQTASSLNVSGVLWTLTIEICLYATMPLLALAVARAPARAVAGTILIGLAWRYIVARHGDGIVRFYFNGAVDASFEPVARLFAAQQFVGFLGVFGLGIGLRWLEYSGSPVVRWVHERRSLSLPMILLSMVPAALMLRFVERASHYTHWVWFTGYNLVIAALLTLPLLVAGIPAHDSSRALRSAEWLGQRSYGLYLWHFPVILSIYGRGPFVNPPDVRWWQFKLPLIIGVAVLFAHLSYVCVERPAQEFGRAFVTSRRVRKEAVS